MKNVLFYSKHLMSVITNQELDQELDQEFSVNLYDNGVLSLLYKTKEGTLKSRISLDLASCRVVELFTEVADASYYQLRVDGGVVPFFLAANECDSFMNAIDSLKHKTYTSNEHNVL